MTFLDLVRKVGELGRAKCHPDCDIVVHRREAAMYMGVLRENPELLRELAATLSSGVSEGKAESGERIPGRDYCPLDGEPLWLRIQSGGKPQLYIHADRLTWHTDVTDKIRTAAWEGPTRSAAEVLLEIREQSPGHLTREELPEHYAVAQPPAPSDDAATVLAGLLAGFEHERWWSADDEVKFGIWTKAMKRVEAAQQRLADRGQGGGSDGAQ